MSRILPTDARIVSMESGMRQDAKPDTADVVTLRRTEYNRLPTVLIHPSPFTSLFSPSSQEPAIPRGSSPNLTSAIQIACGLADPVR